MAVLAKKGAPLLDRLMARCIPEPNSGCWLWEGGQTGRYGVSFLPGGIAVGAHRAMMIAQGFDIPADGVVMHRCDNTMCINPDHLQVSTQAENMADMCRKGRHVTRAAVPKEWHAAVREDTTPPWALAAWFGVSIKTIRRIRRTTQ